MFIVTRDGAGQQTNKFIPRIAHYLGISMADDIFVRNYVKKHWQELGLNSINQAYFCSRYDYEGSNAIRDYAEDHGLLLKDFAGLSTVQIYGMIKLDLTRDQVLSPDFDLYTIRNYFAGLSFSLIKRFLERGLTSADIAGLSHFQTHWMIKLDLTRGQVLTPLFGQHTIDAIRSGMEFDEVAGLSPIQVQGMRERRFTRNLPLLAPRAYRAGELIITYPGPRPMSSLVADVDGLSPIQRQGMRELGLTRDQVCTPDFGEHTIIAIRDYGIDFNDVAGIPIWAIYGDLTPSNTHSSWMLQLSATFNHGQPLNAQTLFFLRAISTNRSLIVSNPSSYRHRGIERELRRCKHERLSKFREVLHESEARKLPSPRDLYASSMFFYKANMKWINDMQKDGKLNHLPESQSQIVLHKDAHPICQ